VVYAFLCFLELGVGFFFAFAAVGWQLCARAKKKRDCIQQSLLFCRLVDENLLRLIPPPLTFSQV
ncbi:MAG: hypothetical protein AAF456_08325, partial [Planctomycetota bacterium]